MGLDQAKGEGEVMVALRFDPRNRIGVPPHDDGMLERQPIDREGGEAMFIRDRSRREGGAGGQKKCQRRHEEAPTGPPARGPQSAENHLASFWMSTSAANLG